VVESRLPITHHHASFKVFDESPGHTRLLWITDVLPHTLAVEVRVRVERGGEIMNQTLEAQGRSSPATGAGVSGRQASG